jgi:Bacterial Ig-like domain
VADDEQNTARRVNLPMPEDCTTETSECEDVAILNQLDGFNLQARISVPFDGDIDPSSVTNDTVFLVGLGDALARHEEGLAGEDENFDPSDVRLAATATVGINHIVWTPDTRELSFRPDQTLDQHTTYVLVVTTGVRDTNGDQIGVAEGFSEFRQDLAHDLDRYYRRALLTAKWAVGRVTGGGVEVAALSVFTTQTATHIMERIRDAVQAAPAPAIDFAVGPGGSHAVFSVASLQSVTFNAQTGASGTITPMPLANFVANMRLIPGAVASVAFGRFTALDFTTHPSGHIAAIATRTGTLAPTGTVDVGVTVWLPSGTRPAAGWPVEICAHGSGGNKNFGVSQSSIANSRGIAVIAINAMGHGHGPLSTLALRRTDGTTVTVAAPGSGYDADGNGTIDAFEPRFAPRPLAVWGTSGTVAETAGMHLQLVRALQAGVDVDGDGTADLDASRIYLMGHSLGVAWGEMVFAYEPAIRAAAFVAGSGMLAYGRPLSQGDRPPFGARLAVRTPSLVNSAYGLTSVDGVAVAGPFFNENLPLRDQPPLVNTVPGSVAIQRVIDQNAWAEQIGSSVACAPPAGVPARPFVHQFARSDRQAVNPVTSEIVRAGDFADRVLYYRHDLNFGLAGVPADPHQYITGQQQPANYARVAIGAQNQIATLFETDGAIVTHPTPTELWEAPISSPLPVDTWFLPRP